MVLQNFKYILDNKRDNYRKKFNNEHTKIYVSLEKSANFYTKIG